MPVLLVFTIRPCHSVGDQGLVVGAFGDVLVVAGQAAFDQVHGSLHLLYSPDQFITVAARDFSARLDVGRRQDVADVSQGEPCPLGEQYARDPIEVGTAVAAATSGRPGGREQAHGLPVTQYVRCQAELPADLADAN